MKKHNQLLRKRAEEFLNKSPENVEDLSGEDTLKLIEKLHIHQIELEMQNQELRRAQIELEASRDKYSDLYDFAPVGYLTISKKGLILKANLTIAAMLGVERQVLIKQPFSKFVFRNDQDQYYHHLKTLLKAKTGNTCEIKLVKTDGTLFDALLKSSIIEDSDENGTPIRMAISDIAHQKQTEKTLVNSERELKIRNKIADAFLTFEDGQVYQEVLDIVLGAMKSNKGFLGYINENGALVCPTLTRDIWDQCMVPDKAIVFPRDIWGGMWGRSLVEKKTLYSNQRLSVPKGHILLSRAMSVPILFHDEVIGQITVANKATDYNEQDKQLLETITNFIAPVLNARLQRDHQERKRKLAETELKNSHDALEQKVKERASELITTNEQLEIKIDEHKQAEKMHRESEERYRLLIRTLPGLVYKGYKDWSVDFIDDKIEVLTGYKANHFNIDRMKWSDIIIEEDLETAKQSFIQALKTGKSFVREYRIKLRSGDIKWIRDRGHIVHNSHGDIDYISGVFFDITDQKEQEEEFLKTQNLLQTVFDGIPDPLVMLDEGLKVKALNKAALRYYQIEKPEDIKEGCCYQAIRGKSEPCEGCRIPELVESKKSGSFERIGLMDSSKLEDVLIYAIDKKKHRFSGAVTRIRDITKDKLMERKVIHSEKLASLGITVSCITHEITNPISAITFNAPILKDYIEALLSIADAYAENVSDLELLKMPYAKFKEDAVKIITNILHASQRISTTVSNLRRLSSKKDRLKKQWFHVKQVIERITALMRFEIHQYVKNFEINLSENLPEIYSDPETLEQILMNIVMNAAHAADKEDSRIVLEAIPGNSWQDHMVIQIRDNGPGMDEYTMSKIFTPFFSTKEPGMGTGLGLYLCQDLVKDLGGRIEVQSEVGKGSVFSIYLPDVERRAMTRL